LAFRISEIPKQSKAELILLIVALNWGLTFPFTKIMLEFISPALSVLIRFSITIGIFILLFPSVPGSLNKHDLKPGLLLGIFLFAGFITQTIGMSYTTASKAGFITGTYILMVPALQLFISKRKFMPENIAGVIISTTGLFLLSGMGIDEINTGDVLVLICAAFYALHIIYLDKFSRRDGANINALIFLQFAVMVLFSIPSVWLFDHYSNLGIFITISPALIGTILFNTLIATLLGFILVNRFQRYTLPVKAALIYSFEQVFAAIFAYLILSELLSSIQITGCLFMLTGLAVSEFYRPLFKKQTT
jgi:drug/metabolite transporter (DMT)-like permease